MIAIGGGIVVAYVQSDAKLNPLAAAQLGLSAPLLLRSLTQASPKLEPGKVD